MSQPGGSYSPPASWTAFVLLAIAVAWLWLIRTLTRLVAEFFGELRKLLLDRSDSP